MTSIHQPEPPKPSEPPEPLWFSGPINIRSVALTGIFVLMVMYTLYLAAPLFMPLTVAFLVSMMFAPIIRWLRSIKIPSPISAAVVLASLLALGFGAVYGLSVPAAQWIQKAPQELRKIDYKLYELVGPIDKLKEVKKEIEKAVPGESNGPADSMAPMRWNPIQWLLTSTWAVVYGLGVSVILLYFLLASGDTFLRKLVRLLPRFEDKRNAVETVQHIQRSIAIFLGTITLINIGLGAVAAAALYAIGMPNPLLFGVMVGLFNFAPYIGPLVSSVVLLFVALLSLDDISRILLAPGLVLALNALEGQLITPILTGHRLDLSPVAVFVSITLWGWMWGVVGILIAVPLVASAKIVCDRIEPLQPIGTFLGH
ncbi:MAG: AI-2E family transporter [Nitrococcus mobilis]|nr:AI-2E family transporter [Nitrococcus mobilis]